jgi:hypothetical protein
MWQKTSDAEKHLIAFKTSDAETHLIRFKTSDAENHFITFKTSDAKKHLIAFKTSDAENHLITFQTSDAKNHLITSKTSDAEKHLIAFRTSDAEKLLITSKTSDAENHFLTFVFPSTRGQKIPSLSYKQQQKNCNWHFFSRGVKVYLYVALFSWTVFTPQSTGFKLHAVHFGSQCLRARGGMLQGNFIFLSWNKPRLHTRSITWIGMTFYVSQFLTLTHQHICWGQGCAKFSKKCQY